MAFAPDDVAAGLEQLFAKRGWTWTCERPSPERYDLRLSLSQIGEVTIVVQPLPVERVTFALFPRTLLQVSASAGDLEPLRRDILLAFLRVAG